MFSYGWASRRDSGAHRRQCVALRVIPVSMRIGFQSPYASSMKSAFVAIAASVIVAGVVAPTASAEPISDHHSANPYLEQLWRSMEGRGFGYLEWQAVQGVWMSVCEILRNPALTRDDAVNVVAGRSFSRAEAAGIVDSAAFSVCIGFR